VLCVLVSAQLAFCCAALNLVEHFAVESCLAGLAPSSGSTSF
jgi:hypothetical protein